jgi:hypothetical protein
VCVFKKRSDDNYREFRTVKTESVKGVPIEIFINFHIITYQRMTGDIQGAFLAILAEDERVKILFNVHDG